MSDIRKPAREISELGDKEAKDFVLTTLSDLLESGKVGLKQFEDEASVPGNTPTLEDLAKFVGIVRKLDTSVVVDTADTARVYHEGDSSGVPYSIQFNSRSGEVFELSIYRYDKDDPDKDTAYLLVTGYLREGNIFALDVTYQDNEVDGRAEIGWFIYAPEKLTQLEAPTS